jgi:hypothetical protein
MKYRVLRGLRQLRLPMWAPRAVEHAAEEPTAIEAPMWSLTSACVGRAGGVENLRSMPRFGEPMMLGPGTSVDPAPRLLLVANQPRPFNSV